MNRQLQRLTAGRWFPDRTARTDRRTGGPACWKVLAGTAALILGGVLTGAPQAGGVALAAPSPVTMTFTTPGTFSWTVPMEVYAASFDVYGAEGGSGAGTLAAHGGSGGEVRASLPVTPGRTLLITVGGAGGSGAVGGAAAAGGAGGFNGGASGGGFGYVSAGGGGGASDVRFGGSGLSARVIVAGGGGGGGPSCCIANPAYGGGAGGGLVGGNGGGGALGGAGGTATGGGSGGLDGCQGAGSSGAAGSLGSGGIGGESGLENVTAGGGGGGGYYGGGGGGVSCRYKAGAGGGGGSGYAEPSATGVSMASGVKSGNGKVVITYQVASFTANDTDPGITYLGTGWVYSSGRGKGDYQNDVHATQVNGDAFSYTFTGTGISWITEKSADEGKADVYIDGVYQARIDCNTSRYNVPQQVLYRITGLSLGQHTLRVVKVDGPWMLLDAVTVTTAGTTANDTDPGITYTGSGWFYSSGRGVGDYQDDVHATTMNGDAFSYRFTGTGISWVTEKSADEGKSDVYIDGVYQARIDANSNQYTIPQQVVYRITGLTAGPHTLRVVKVDGPWMLLDALTTT